MRLRPKNSGGRMRNFWPAFRKLGQKSQPEQSAKLRGIFPNGTCLVVTFAASEEIFPEKRQNFLASIAAHPELESRLTKEF
jgi:hypothetical protein